MHINELLKLYHEFFEKLSKIEQSYPDNFDAASIEDINELAQEFDLFIPDDIKEFLCVEKTIHSISADDDFEWEAGFDFCDLDIIRRDLPMYRNELAKNYDEKNFLKHLHLKGVPLSFSEPALIFDADNDKKQPSIFLMLWDGDASTNAIAPDFTTFFTHWLASGCFRNGDFKQYWEMVKDFVPISIPLEENLWLIYYNEIYKDVNPIF